MISIFIQPFVPTQILNSGDIALTPRHLLDNVLGHSWLSQMG